MKSALFALLMMLLAVSPLRAGAPEELFRQANDTFARATAARGSDDAGARVLYAQSIALYRQIIDEHAIASPDLFFNIANAYALSGDVGRAVLNYRRALDLSPNDPDILANLSATRARVGVDVKTSGSSQLARALLEWHLIVPSRVRLIIALTAFAATWLVLTLRLAPAARRGAPRWLAGGCAVIAVLAALSVWTEHAGRTRNPAAVVVAESVVGRKGPDERGYEPSFTRPLSAGVEVTIVERRAGWALVRLGDDRETWLPEGSWEEVRPSV